MPITLKLTPEQEARLAARARAAGAVNAEEYLLCIIDGGELGKDVEENDPTLALFAQWDREDANLTAEEIELENKDWEQFKANINAERARVGAKPAF